jgi:hypothetical protein
LTTLSTWIVVLIILQIKNSVLISFAILKNKARIAIGSYVLLSFNLLHYRLLNNNTERRGCTFYLKLITKETFLFAFLHTTILLTAARSGSSWFLFWYSNPESPGICWPRPELSGRLASSSCPRSFEGWFHNTSFHWLTQPYLEFFFWGVLPTIRHCQCDFGSFLENS